jgi:hypothetical protein
LAKEERSTLNAQRLALKLQVCLVEKEGMISSVDFLAVNHYHFRAFSA